MSQGQNGFLNSEFAAIPHILALMPLTYFTNDDRFHIIPLQKSNN